MGWIASCGDGGTGRQVALKTARLAVAEDVGDVGFRILKEAKTRGRNPERVRGARKDPRTGVGSILKD